ncbi:MAG TPA: hypothetical protein DCQ06_13825 [Myxococcales bacterium]|nr:hypothetical protein [Myxococcales bacterium]
MIIVAPGLMMTLVVVSSVIWRFRRQSHSAAAPWIASIGVCVALWRATHPDLQATCLCVAAALLVQGIWHFSARAHVAGVALSLISLLSPQAPPPSIWAAQLMAVLVALTSIGALSIGLTNPSRLVWALVIWSLPEVLIEPASAQLGIPVTGAIGQWTQQAGVRFVVDDVPSWAAHVWSWAGLVLAGLVIFRAACSPRAIRTLSVVAGLLLGAAALTQIVTLLNGEMLVTASGHVGQPLWLSQPRSVDWTSALVALVHVLALLSLVSWPASEAMVCPKRVQRWLYGATCLSASGAMLVAVSSHFERFGAGVWFDPVWHLLLLAVLLSALVLCFK